MATIRDVAKKAGVSVATVSRVMNESGYVSEDTRKKVKDAINKLNYKPNEVARSLFKRESRLIGLLLPDITNPYFPLLARGIEDEIHKQGFRVILGNSDEDMKKEINYISTFIQNNVVGIISTTNDPEHPNYQNLQIPVVFLDRISEKQPSVHADGITGGRIAAEEMIRRGSTEIVLMKGPAHIRPAQERFQGAFQFLQEKNIDFHVMHTSSFSFREAQQWAEDLFKTYPQTDGVIASNDIVATAVLHEALRLGKAIPEQLQIIGFDDIPQSSLLYPALSTIRQPAYEMGQQAAKLLCALINKKKIEEKIIKMPVTFIERNTTRKVDTYG